MRKEEEGQVRQEEAVGVNTHLSISCQGNHCLTCGCSISGKDGEIHLKISYYVCHHGNIKHSISLPHLIC